MKTATNVARFALVGSGALLLVLGLFIWIGDNEALIGTHETLGYLLVLSLWTIALIAARSGVSIGLAASAFVWGLVAVALGLSQEYLLAGNWHWTIQVMHVLISMGAIGWGQGLVILIRRHDVAGGSRQRREPSFSG